MKIGDKVSFLSEVGGGKVAGFQGKNIVLVEDEDGFQIPMPVNEVVVVKQDDYTTANVINKRAEAEEHRAQETPLNRGGRSVKAMMRSRILLIGLSKMYGNLPITFAFGYIIIKTRYKITIRNSH